MVGRHCRGRLDLFPSTKVNSMFKNKYSINNNDIVQFLHVFNWKSNKHKQSWWYAEIIRNITIHVKMYELNRAGGMLK